MIHTHQQREPIPAKPVDFVRVSEMCIRCRIRPVNVDRAFQFVNGLRITIRSEEPICLFCK